MGFHRKGDPQGKLGHFNHVDKRHSHGTMVLVNAIGRRRGRVEEYMFFSNEQKEQLLEANGEMSVDDAVKIYNTMNEEQKLAFFWALKHGMDALTN